MFLDGCNYIFLDHRPLPIVIEKLRFYRELFPERKFGLIYNLPVDIELPEDLGDITVVRLPSDFGVIGYEAASLWATTMVPTLAASPDFRGRPTVPIECDLEIAKLDYESRVFSVLSAPSQKSYGASCWIAKAPAPKLFHGGDEKLVELYERVAGETSPKIASTLGSFVFTEKGADAFLSLMRRPETREYYHYLIEAAAQVRKGRRRICYATHYFTDYAFALAVRLEGLAFAECVNRINPKVPTRMLDQDGAASTNSPLSVEEFEWMIEDDRYYVLHHLATDRDRFEGAKECTLALRKRLLEERNSERVLLLSH
jgi:hypothetical protein